MTISAPTTPTVWLTRKSVKPMPAWAPISWVAVPSASLSLGRGFPRMSSTGGLPAVPASRMKEWLRGLNDSLIPKSYYNVCISMAKDSNVTAESLDVLPRLLAGEPPGTVVSLPDNGRALIIGRCARGVELIGGEQKTGNFC